MGSLKQCAENGSLKTFEEIENKVKADSGDYSHCLELAIYNDYYDIAKLLFSRGYDLSWTAGQLERCLNGICAHLYTERMRLLIIEHYKHTSWSIVISY